MKQLLVLIILFLLQHTYGQQVYRDSLYTNVVVSTHKFATVGAENLEMDFYRATGATGKMPLVVYVHGGGFNSGSRNSQGIQFFAKRLAKRGYAVASISYRLTLVGAGEDCEVPSEKKELAIQEATNDLGKAISYMIKDQNKALFPIDTKKIILAGSSAGAEAVLNMVYGTETFNDLKNIRFAGVIGISGAIMDKDNVTAEKAIPTLLFHGTDDEVVPYESKSHKSCQRRDPGHFILHGSGVIAEKLKDIDKPYYLYTIVKGTHAWAGIPTKRCFSEIIDFLYNDVMYPNLIRQTERSVKAK